ncbi:155f0597-f3a3-42ef-9315-100e4f8f9811 [Thermothielavioides terrestris]|uniref:155f0597-f3a3-42ef-9315-100e4f8f9811 n=1 Tax=Thermothielavioides terrestris TaxID=2587410 RepID=A0A3S4AQ28_9PEZI|nr:155f0597-f3a3-42ef-9315-100e4f8f9811 [Thermothielavioides terrestris]
MPPETDMRKDAPGTVGANQVRSSDEATVNGTSDAEKAPVAAPPPKPAGDAQLVTGVKLWFMLISIYLACFLMVLDTTVVSTAVPQITDEFNSLHDVGWYGSAYYLGCATVAPLTGKIYRHFNLKWSFLALFLVFEIGSALCGAAQSSPMLIGGRAVAGVVLIGMMMGIAQLGNIAGPLVGGAFTTGYTWRWSFYINLPLGVIVGIPLIFLRIAEQAPKDPFFKVISRLHHYLDLVGFALFAGAVAQLLLALQFGGNQFAWNSSQVIGLFCGAGVTGLVWLAWDWHKGDAALLPISMLKRQAVWTSTINYSFLMSTLFGASYFLPIYFQAVKGVNAALSGVYLLPTIISQLISTVLSGKLLSKLGYVPPFAIYAATLSAIGSGLYSLFQPDTSTGKWIGFQILTGAGRGAGFQMPFIAVQNAVTFAELATANAFVVWAQYIGPTIFLTLCNTILQTSLESELPAHAPNANATAIIAAGATNFRAFVSAQDLPGVLVAYSNSVDHVFYLVAAAGVVAWLAAWGMGWNDIRKKNQPPPKPQEQTQPAAKEGEVEGKEDP